MPPDDERHMMSDESLQIEFCGEIHRCEPDALFTVGRDADLSVDDNPFLHRRLLEFRYEAGLWWVVNIGQSLPVSLSVGDGSYHARIASGGQAPLVFPRMVAMFSAGPFTYEIGLEVTGATFHARRAQTLPAPAGVDTVGGVELTPSQLLLVLALCEPVLRTRGHGIGELPSSARAAGRLGWPLTTFNRKLDAVCDKLDRAGVGGLRGGAGRMARNRRARLVEYAVLSQLVTPDDLHLLDRLPQAREEA